MANIIAEYMITFSACGNSARAGNNNVSSTGTTDIVDAGFYEIVSDMFFL